MKKTVYILRIIAAAVLVSCKKEKQLPEGEGYLQLTSVSASGEYVTKSTNTDVREFVNGERFIDGYLHVFGHTLHEGGPISIRKRGICLDCARAFVLDPSYN